jgi:hypothetical protein
VCLMGQEYGTCFSVNTDFMNWNAYTSLMNFRVTEMFFGDSLNIYIYIYIYICIHKLIFLVLNPQY